MTDLVSSTRAAYCLAASESAKGRSRDVGGEGEAEEEEESEGGIRARAAAPRSAVQQEAEEEVLPRGLGDHSRSAKRQRAAGDSSACGGEEKEREKG